ncbi:MAG: hypothetical protein RLY86_4175 [Pseudomonadota bacterium]|jgi:pimeloyl-ACP methyl ester carboxylesterase
MTDKLPDSLPLTFLDAAPADGGAAGDAVPLLVLHGLFGSARNWLQYTRLWGQKRPTYALDLRNHGASPWADTMSYREMAGDVARFLDDRGIDRAVVLGHSMGGKAAMTLALTRPERVERLIVVDIAPVAYTHTFAPYVAAMKAADLSGVTRRSQADGMLADGVPNPILRAFLMQNLEQAETGMRWRVNLDAIAACMGDLIGFPDDLGNARYGGPTLFIGGATSDYITAAYEGEIHRRFTDAAVEMIPGAGHWVHAEKPDPFRALVDRLL